MTKLIHSVLTAAFCTTSAGAFVTSAARRGPVPLASTATTSSVRQLSSVGTQLKMAESPADFVKAEVAKNNVVIFSKSYCPFCTATKGLFHDMGALDSATVFELDQISNGGEIQSALLDITGQRTVPNTFVGGKHLGGNDDAHAAFRSGKLEEMLNAN